MLLPFPLELVCRYRNEMIFSHVQGVFSHHKVMICYDILVLAS
jgi:hypothetical protein